VNDSNKLTTHIATELVTTVKSLTRQVPGDL